MVLLTITQSARLTLGVMPTIDVTGGTVHYETRGQGTPVMLISGLAGTGRGWGPQIELFSRDFFTIVPDHPGTGGSSIPDNGFEIEHHAAAMADLARSLDAGPVHLVGSSTGGAIAHVMALDHPDIVASATLASSWARNDDFFRQQFAVRKQVLLELGTDAYTDLTALFLYSPEFIANRTDVVQAWIDTAKASGTAPEVLAARIDMIMRHDQAERLEQVACPVLVLVGSADSCTPPYLSEALAAAIPGARLEILTGGHIIYKEDPEGFHSAVSGFIRSCD